MSTQQTTIRSMVLIALFATLTAVGAFIKIPLFLVPFTLQTFFVFLSGNLLRPMHAFYTQALYLGIGLLGFPILANGGGISYIFQPTFGFLIGNILAVFVIALCLAKTPNPSTRQFIQANLLGLMIIYLVGIIYFYGILNFWLEQSTTWSYALSIAILPFIIPDIIKCILAAFFSEKLRTRMPIHTFKPPKN